jgi:hypothetical protein
VGVTVGVVVGGGLECDDWLELDPAELFCWLPELALRLVDECAVTITDIEEVTFPFMIVTLVSPAATPVTFPKALTFATLGLAVFQMTWDR